MPPSPTCAPAATPGSHLPGIALGITAASIWGLSIVIPVLLPGWSALDITLARYLCYGLVSGLILLRGRRNGFQPLMRRHWGAAAAFALLGYFIPYLLLVSSIQDIGPAVPALLMGTSPVTVALYGNLRRREFPFTRLLPPLLAIFAGLAVVNAGRYGLSQMAGPGAGTAGAAMVPGLLKSLASLAALTWFLVANLVFLRSNPQIGPVQWASAVGTVLGGMSLLLLPAALLGRPEAGMQPLLPFLVFLGWAGLVLGVGSSWLGGVLWNKACCHIPASLAGQLIVFWPVSGLVMAYLIEGRLPSAVEAGGVALTLAGVLAGIWITGRKSGNATGER